MGWTEDYLRRLFGEQQGVISPWREFRHDWTIGSVGMDKMALFAEKMLSVRQEVQGFASADLGERHFASLWLLKGTLPAMSQP